MGDERERMAQDIESYRRERKKLQAENADLKAVNARLREFAETVVAMCVPMPPPADNPVPEVIASVLLSLARAALGETDEH